MSPVATAPDTLGQLLRGEWQRLRAAARGYRDFLRYALHATKQQPA